MVSKLLRGIFGGGGNQSRHVDAPAGEVERAVTKSMELLAAGKGDEAIAVYNEFITQNPSNFHGYQNRGSMYVILEQFDNAIADFNQALAITPQSPMSLRSRASAYEAQGNIAQAERDYSDSLRAKGAPREWVADSHMRRGILRESSGNMRGAFEDYGRAIAIDQSLDEKSDSVYEAYYRQAEILLALNQPGEALDVISKALDKVEGDPRMFTLAGRAYSATGDFKEAVDIFDASININPDNAAAYGHRAFAKLGSSDYEGALSDLDKAMEMGIEDAGLIANRGGALMSLGRLDEALADYTKALGMDPTDAVGYAQRALVYRQMGRIEESNADIANAIENGYDREALEESIRQFDAQQ